MDRWTTTTCRANGIEIHFLRTGGDKPPVVLLHGLTKSGVCWTPLARALESSYDVIMPDARGHGNSSSTAIGYTYDTLASDVLSVVEALQIAHPVLVGHSMGGMTAALAASRSGKKFRGVVLADPTFLSPERQREVYASDVAAQHRQILTRSREDFQAELRARYGRPSELIEWFVEARFKTGIQAFEILKPPNPDYLQLIKEIDIPCLLVIGGAGGIITPDVAAVLARVNHKLEVVQIAESGHGIPYDQPDRFAAIIQAFLRKVCV